MSSYAPQKVLDAIKVPHRLRMGLTRLRPEELWLDVDDALLDELGEKERLLAERHDEVFVELAESRPAQREIANTLLETLLRDYPDRYRRDADTLLIDGKAHAFSVADLVDDARAPLEVISRFAQEDLCVMERRGGRWCLSAGSVCFPTRWDLRSKLGLPLDAIHGPVPGYREVLAASVDRFFEGLVVGRTVWRSNWSLVDDPTLFQPRVHPANARQIDARNAGEKIWWRLERQTLHRFPGSDAVLFTIRVYQTPLRILRADKEAARALAGAIRTMPEALLRYKSIPPFRDAVVSYLERGEGK